MRALKYSDYPIQILCLLLWLPFLTSRAAVGAEASYLAILVPGALGTFPMSMNNAMTVTGYYTTSPSTASAFIRDGAGTITTFSVRGGLWTEPESMNEAGDITGFYEVVAGQPQSFLRYANGRVVTFDPPAKNCSSDESISQPVAINNFDEIVGNFPSPCYASATFIRSRVGILGVATSLSGGDYPIGLTGLNSNGTVIGYSAGDGVYTVAQSWVSDANGYGSGITVPVSGLPIAEEATIAEAVNDGGVVAGWYSYHCHIPSCAPGAGGFVRSADGEYTVFNPPGTLLRPALPTYFEVGGPLWSAPKSLSLNASGVIAGTYTDAAGARHGFVRNPYGTITSFDPPRGMRTTATSINDSGVIAGTFYYDWNPQTSIGFLRIPAK